MLSKALFLSAISSLENSLTHFKFAKFNSDDTAISYPFDGDIEITGNKSHFKITYTKLTVDACTRLASIDWGSKYSGLEAIFIGWWSADIDYILSSRFDKPICYPQEGECGFKNLPVSISDSRTYCQAMQDNIAGSNNPSTMVTWVFK